MPTEKEIVQDQLASVGEEAPSKMIGSRDVDEALPFLANEHVTPLSEADEKKLVRKIDWRIVPLLLACYMLEFLDKTLRTSRREVPSVLQIAEG